MRLLTVSPNTERLLTIAICVAALALIPTSLTTLIVVTKSDGTAKEAVDVSKAERLRVRSEAIDGLITMTNGSALFRAGATLALVEFSDFQCPYCGAYTRDTYPHIQRDYVRRGLVNYVFRHFPLDTIHPFAVKAAEAAECAGEQGKFWEMHDRLFAHQDRLNDAAVQQYAADTGLDVRRFVSCLKGRVTQRIKEDKAEGLRLGVVSTPTFFLGVVDSDGTIKIRRKVTGAQPYDFFAMTIDDVRRPPSAAALGK